MNPPDFSHHCGVHTPQREQALQKALQRIREHHLAQVRFVWCDIHGTTRSKTLMPDAVEAGLRNGVSMVSTLMLKDTSDRTAFKVFEPGGTDGLQGFGQGNNLILLPSAIELHRLPWAPEVGWIQCQAWFQDGTPVVWDSRRVLQAAVAQLQSRGWGLQCGLEIEFHIYRMRGPAPHIGPHTDPHQAAWPGPPPEVDLIHPGSALLSEAHSDSAHAALSIVQQTAQSMELPLMSLEIELGPSQVEAVFAPTDALLAADNMVRFRNGVRQALAREGYWASFICRPPFEHIMSSGWHLHQSLVALDGGTNLFVREAPASGSSALEAQHTLSALGAHYLAGLLAHAPGSLVFCTPTANGYGRFRPLALAPQAVVWGRDNRGAMLRVIGQAQDPGTRIENRIGEPAANPYLYMACQIHAGLDGIERQLPAPLATESPYGQGHRLLPTDLGQALVALQDDPHMVRAFGPGFVSLLSGIKQLEWQRYQQAEDKQVFHQNEYFSRI
ncbi:MAG: glutamine synthetase [Betaproteobacteria bacterium]|nr:glutamine synthetase [Betaproteobacteria bacterium]